MAKMKKEEIESIVRRNMPGFRVASKAGPRAAADAAKNRAAADANTPDLDALRRKFLRGDSQTAAGRDANRRKAAAPQVPQVDDDEIIAIEPTDALDARDRATRSKAIVVSGRSKRIVGKQG